MTWQQSLGALVLVLVYLRTAWMVLQPRHRRSAPVSAR